MDLPPNSFCADCLKKQTDCKKLRRCSKCQRAHYCSRKCQVKDWKKRHKDVCVKKFMDGMMQHNEETYGSCEQPNLPKSLLKRSVFTSFFVSCVKRRYNVPEPIGRMVFSYLTGYRTTFRVLDLELDWFVRDYMEASRAQQLKVNRFDDIFFAKNGVGFSLIRDSIDVEFGDVIEVLQNVIVGGGNQTFGGHINCGFGRFDFVKARFTPKHYAAFMRCIARFLGYEPHSLGGFGMSWSVSADVDLRKAILEAMQRENDKETGRKIVAVGDFYEPGAAVRPEMDAGMRRTMQEFGMRECYERLKLMHSGGVADLFDKFR